MPKLLSRSNHEEFELNSALQIINQKERRTQNAWKLEHAGNLTGLRNFGNLQNFTGYEFSQLANFSQVAKFPPVPLFTSHGTIHIPTARMNFFLFVPLFGFLPTFSL